MERIAQGRSATLTHTFFEDGTPTDPSPDSASLTITRADGTSLVPSDSVTDAGTGVFSITLTPEETANLDVLTITWSATFGGQVQQFTDYIEVVGGFLFTIAEARALKPLDQTSVYSTAAIVAMRNTVEQALEDECGVAFVPRYTLETVSGTGTSMLPLRWPKIRAIRSASITTAGTATALTASELALLTLGGWGGIDGYTWTAGTGNVTVGYEHGFDRPPEEIKRAALLLTKIWLTGENRPKDDRAITYSSDAGGTYSLSVPGRNGSAFGHPDVDVAVQRYSLRVGVA